MKTIYFIVVVICLASCEQSHSDKKKTKDFYEKLEDLVFEEENTGIEYFSKIEKNNEVIEYKVTYLGKIANSKNDDLELLYSTVYTGKYDDSKRANSTLIVFLNKKRLGSYQIGGGFNKIPTISKDELVINYDDDNCNETTKLNFRDSIPQKIFINCKIENGKMMGDLYNFVEIPNR